MIRVESTDEPDSFDDCVRTLGNEWLSIIRGNGITEFELLKFPDHWLDVRAELKSVFKNRCGYSATIVPGPGEVDHYIAKTSSPDQAYEWSNYRFSSSDINKKKGTHNDKILDPFKIHNGWLRMNEASFEIEITKNMPFAFHEQAQFTLDKLGINNDNSIITRLTAAANALSNPGNQALLDQVAQDYPMVADAISHIWSNSNIDKDALALTLRELFWKHRILVVNEFVLQGLSRV